MADLPLLVDSVPLLEQRTKINDTITKTNLQQDKQDTLFSPAYGAMMLPQGFPSLTANYWSTISDEFTYSSLSKNVTINTNSGTLTPLVSGIYKISFNVTCTANNGELLEFAVNDGGVLVSNYGDVMSGEGSGTLVKSNAEIDLTLNANQSVSLAVRASTSNSNLGFSKGYFSITKIDN